MTKEQKEKERDAKIDSLIDRFDMTAKCDLTREQIHKRAIKGMVCTNLAYVIADVANTLLLDAESELAPMQVCFRHTEKYYYKHMLDAIRSAKKWAEKSSFEPYLTNDANLFAEDSDWWYNIIRLIEDRTGDNIQKTKIILNWLLTMPSEMNLFKVRMSDFKRTLYNVDDDGRENKDI